MDAFEIEFPVNILTKQVLFFTSYNYTPKICKTTGQLTFVNSKRILSPSQMLVFTQVY